MILNTGQRTDIPAYYGKWLLNRLQEGFVLVRNPFHPTAVTRYRLTPELIDCLCFCTKNPAPLLPHLSALSAYRHYWHITITPYGKDVEPFVPDWHTVAASFRQLSEQVGRKRICWRYDPIFLTDTHSLDFHIAVFREMAEALCGAAEGCIISFIDLYEKTKRNFKGIRPVAAAEQELLAKHFSEIGCEYGIRIIGCCENPALSRFGIETSGCMTKEVLERALGERLEIPATEGKARPECRCLIGHDIGAYNTCGHGCRYCYANYDRETVERNMRLHDPESPLLVGRLTPDDTIHEAKQVRYTHGQLRLEDFL